MPVKTNAAKGFLHSGGYDGTWFYRQGVMGKAMKTHSGKNREPARFNVDTSCKDDLTKWGDQKPLNKRGNTTKPYK